MKRYRLGLAAAAIAMIAPVSGCAALISPQQTHDYQYAAGDGGSLNNLAGVDVRNVLLIAGDNGDAQLMYALINTSDETANVKISVGTKTVSETVKPDQSVYHNPENKVAAPSEDNSSSKITSDPVIVKNLDEKPGHLSTVRFDVNGQTSEVKAQVLTGDLEYYKKLEPKGAAGKSKATETPGVTSTDGEDSSEG